MATKIDMLFLDKIKNIVDFELVLRKNPLGREYLLDAKRLGFSDSFLGKLWNKTAEEIFALRKEYGIFPVYKMIDTCASVSILLVLDLHRSSSFVILSRLSIL